VPYPRALPSPSPPSSSHTSIRVSDALVCRLGSSGKPIAARFMSFSNIGQSRGLFRFAPRDFRSFLPLENQQVDKERPHGYLVKECRDVIACVFNQLFSHARLISETYTPDFVDRLKAKTAIIHVTSGQTDSEQFQLVNMETSSSAHGRLGDERRYSINSEDQRTAPVNPLGRDETADEARRRRKWKRGRKFSISISSPVRA